MTTLTKISCAAPLLLIAYTITVAAQVPDRGLTRPTGAVKRLALVVGNDSYPNAALRNARNDARAIAAMLGNELGFKTTLLEDATRDQMSRALVTITDDLGPEDVVFFYYAGHGIQIGGENYLIPIDYSGSSAAAARLGALAVSQLESGLNQAKVAMIVLDACRNNPYLGQRSAAGGLAAMEARGSLIAFATAVGQTAADNAGAQNGLFTQELLQALREPNVSARNIFQNVRQRVADASNRRQIPALYDGLLGDFVFRPTAPASPSSPAAPPAAPAPDARRTTGSQVLVPGIWSGTLIFGATTTKIRIQFKEDSTLDLTTQGRSVASGSWSERYRLCRCPAPSARRIHLRPEDDHLRDLGPLHGQRSIRWEHRSL